MGPIRPAGYDVAIGGACTAAGLLTVPRGEVRTCTVTADDIAPRTPARIVYGDAPAPGWANWSWETDVNPAQAASVFEGASALSAEVTGTWGGL